jgi:hypothetical protein
MIEIHLVHQWPAWFAIRDEARTLVRQFAVEVGAPSQSIVLYGGTDAARHTRRLTSFDP